MGVLQHPQLVLEHPQLGSQHPQHRSCLLCYLICTSNLGQEVDQIRGEIRIFRDFAGTLSTCHPQSTPKFVDEATPLPKTTKAPPYGTGRHSRGLSGGCLQRSVRRAPPEVGRTPLKVCRVSRGLSGGRVKRSVGRAPPEVCREGAFRGLSGGRL